MVVLVVKNPSVITGDAGDLGSMPEPGGRHDNLLHPVFVPGESSGQKNLVDYSP